jgi:hypothetical protein
MHVSMLCWNFGLIPSQALNILFALCGITGSLYGMGRKLDHVERKHFSTALFVCPSNQLDSVLWATGFIMLTLVFS